MSVNVICAACALPLSLHWGDAAMMCDTLLPAVSIFGTSNFSATNMFASTKLLNERERKTQIAFNLPALSKSAAAVNCASALANGWHWSEFNYGNDIMKSTT